MGEAKEKESRPASVEQAIDAVKWNKYSSWVELIGEADKDRWQPGESFDTQQSRIT